MNRLDRHGAKTIWFGNLRNAAHRLTVWQSIKPLSFSWLNINSNLSNKMTINTHSQELCQ